MFYGKDSIEENFDVLLNKLEEQELFVFKPMPIFKHGERWTDEFRIRDGHTKLADGSWVTIIKVTELINKLKQDTIETYDNYQDALKNNSALKRQRHEMEFGLRSAQKSLNKALAMKGDSNEQ
jgi:hypothetical protein